MTNDEFQRFLKLHRSTEDKDGPMYRFTDIFVCEIEKLRAQNAKMVAMLRRIDNPYDCIACGSVTETHRPDCELAALIKECGGE